MTFDILKSEDGRWMFKSGMVYKRAFHLKARLLASLESETFKERAVLLSSNCLICGKGLTDPVSRARLIGPECAGRASIVDTLTSDLGQSTLRVPRMELFETIRSKRMTWMK